MEHKTTRRRCAIYTRKSCEDGLELEYNSLDAQYDSAVSYIRSQAANGWEIIPKRYDDGGFSGGNTNRPALKELLSDIENEKVDIVVVYKIDRLSRSLGDFMDLSKVFEKHNVSFVSVTQQIDTSNAAGRMMLNILMSFAQFEREMTADRIRDKIYASRKKGLWTGGATPFGYKMVEKRLKPDPNTAPIVKYVFERFAETGSAKLTVQEVQRKFGPRHFTRADQKDPSWRMMHVYRILRNKTYKGELEHHASGSVFKGVHEPLVNETLWNDCNRILDESAARQPNTHRETTAMLKGLLKCGHCGCAMAPTFSIKRKGMRYSYYRCVSSTKLGESKCPIKSISSELIERHVISQLGVILRMPEFMKRVSEGVGCSEDEVNLALADIPSFFEGLFPPERDRLLHCLLEQVTVRKDGIDLEFKMNGMNDFIMEMVNGHSK